MNSISIKPDPALQPFIQAYMYSSVGVKSQQMVLDLFPVGHAVMAFILDETHFLYNVHKDKHYRIRFNFTGQLSRHQLLHTSSASMVYVMFRPYGVFRLLGIPQHQLADDCSAVSDILTKDVDELCKRMEDGAKDPVAVVRLLEEWLLKQWRKNEKLNTDRISYACNQILLSAGSLPVKDLCSLTNMSKSSLEQHFNEQVGLSPKMFSRVIRFNEVHKRMQNSPGCDWQDIAYRYGYFDQSHFIREFKVFYGYSPSKAHHSNNLSGHLTKHLSGLEDPS